MSALILFQNLMIKIINNMINSLKSSGNLTDIYTQMQNIRDLAKDMGLDDSYINAISEQTAKTKSTLDGYQEFFNQGILQDKIINKNI